MQLMADPLFEIGNHGWSHGNFGIMSEKAMLEQIRWTQAEYELLREEILKRARAEGRSVELPGSRNVVPLALRQMYGQGACTACARGPAGDPVERGCGNAAGQRGPRYGCAGGRAGAARRDYPVPCQPVPKGSAFMLKETVGELQRKGYRFVTVGELLKLGEPQRTRDGYFNKPGDNLSLDTHFGIDGTGRRK